jgi:sulfatase maturation enzyme AslB (radical SAM superfamily)
MNGGKTDKNALAKRWEEANMTFAAYAAQRHIPLSGAFELTPRCNLKCKMCYVRLDKKRVPHMGRDGTALS